MHIKQMYTDNNNNNNNNTHTHTYEWRDEPVKFLLILPQLHQQQTTEGQVEHGVTLELQVHVQEGKMLRLQHNSGHKKIAT